MKPYYEHGGIAIYHSDCREVLPSLAAVDAVITDEPYGIGSGAAFMRRGGEVIANCDGEGFNRAVEGWIILAAPLLLEGGYLASFTTHEGKHRLEAEMDAAGLIPWMPFYIAKTAPAPNPRACFMNAVEVCAIGYRGKRRWYGGGATPNCWIGLTPNRLGVGVHPTQKPLAAMIRLAAALTPPDGSVLDPFMGSGTTLVAAKQLGRRAVGVEVEERYCEIAARRLQQDVLPIFDPEPLPEDRQPALAME